MSSYLKKGKRGRDKNSSVEPLVRVFADRRGRGNPQSGYLLEDSRLQGPSRFKSPLGSPDVLETVQPAALPTFYGASWHLRDEEEAE